MNQSDDKDFVFKIEGRNPVLEALRSGKSMDKIMIAKDSRGASVNDIMKLASERGVIVKLVEKSLLDKISLSGRHQGVIAHAVPYEYKEVEDIISSAKEKGETPFVLILDSINDPHNFGAILRTAECSGVHGVIIPDRRAVGITSAVVKASAGALEYLTLAKVSNLNTTIDDLKKRGLWVVGADSSGEIYSRHDYTVPLALVIGGEDKGIRRLSKEKCDLLAGIPLKGEIESLNASVAAAILMYEVVRQRS